MMLEFSNLGSVVPFPSSVSVEKDLASTPVTYTGQESATFIDQSTVDLLKLALVNAETDQIVDGYEDLSANSIIDLSGVDFQYSIVGIINPDHPQASEVDSVTFKSPWGISTETIAPYALFGDFKGDFKGKDPTEGTFSLEAIAHNGQKGKREIIDSLNLEMRFVLSPDFSDQLLSLSKPQKVLADRHSLKNSFMGQFDHIVSHFDGNVNDHDDIAALPIAALLTNASQFQDRSTFFYNNNLAEISVDSMVAGMRNSAAFAQELGIKTYDYKDGSKQATNALVDILNSGQKILSLEGGPMEAIYRALTQVSPQNRSNITLVSHGRWNENRNVITVPGVKVARTWADISRDFPEVTLIKISDQNGLDGKGDLGFNSSLWTWLDETSDPILQEARTTMMNAGGGKVNDPSDAGMHFYALTGNETSDPLDAQAFFAANPPSSDSLSSNNSPLLSFSLVNAETDSLVSGFKNLSLNPTINLNDFNFTNYNLLAQVNPDHPDGEVVKSVKFESSLGSRTENVAPYALFGDNGQGDYFGKTLSKGNYAITVTAYSGANSSGSVLGVTNLNLSVTDDLENQPEPLLKLPTLAIEDVSVNEGATVANFTVRLSQASNLPITVQYGTTNGTATSGSDYKAVNGILTFLPGQNTQKIAVPILEDTEFEGNQVFNVNLWNAVGATFADGKAIGTILDNDTAPPPPSGSGKRVILHAMDYRSPNDDRYETPITDTEGTLSNEGIQYNINTETWVTPQDQIFWGDIQISGIAANGQRGIVKSSHDLIGVKSYTYAKGNYNKADLDNAINYMADEGGTETLILKFPDFVRDITLTLTLLDSPEERVRWQAFGTNSSLIHRGVLTTAEGNQVPALDADELNFGKDKTYSFNLSVAGVTQLRLSALPNTGYALAGIAYTV